MKQPNKFMLYVKINLEQLFGDSSLKTGFIMMSKMTCKLHFRKKG